MKTSKIKALAASMLSANPKLEEIFMTSNGQGYTQKNVAESRQNSIDASKKVITFDRSILVADAPKKATEPASESILDLSVPKLTEALEKVSDVDALTQLLADENAKGDDARSTAIKAIESRLEAVKPAQD